MVGTARTVVTGDRRSGGAIGHWRSFMDVVITGTLTLDVAHHHTGEVMVTGGGRARQTYPAKLWSDKSQPLDQGTKVVIIELKQGIAYVDALATHNPKEGTDGNFN